MLLRPRQRLFVERSVRALGEHSNTLGVAPTGAGKTIMLSAVAGDLVGGGAAKACVLAHRDELSDRAVRILQATEAGELLPRIAANPDHHECRMCAWSRRCWSIPA